MLKKQCLFVLCCVVKYRLVSNSDYHMYIISLYIDIVPDFRSDSLFYCNKTMNHFLSLEHYLYIIIIII